MKKTNPTNVKYFIAIFIALFFFVVQPIEFGKDAMFFQRYLIQKPVIRIGLGVNLNKIRVSSSHGMDVYEVSNDYKLIADDIEEIFIKGCEEKIDDKFTIQVGRLEDRAEAEIMTQGLRSKIENRVFITKGTEDRITGTHDVRIGDFLTRDDAMRAIKRLNEDSMLYFIPSNSQTYLSFKGRNYRGIFILKSTSRGIVLVNVLNLEDYLKAVVPSELSPNVFTELEAHKAQAVAARTYAIKNLGMNDELGFDLCDTPKSQFYMGMNVEHPLSTKAVEQTRGEVALYRGKLIDALYTSSCGGRTENVENIFMGPALPYLRSTECIYEKQNGWYLKSENEMLPIYVSGKNISPEIVSLIGLNIIPSETSPIFYKNKASFDEAEKWINSALNLLGLKRCDFGSRDSYLNFGDFTKLIIDSFGRNERVENLTLEGEKNFVLKDGDRWIREVGKNIIYIPQNNKLPATDKIINPERVLTRGELAFSLWKIIHTNSDIARQGIIKGLHKGKIELENEEDKISLTFSSNDYLLKNYAGDRSFASQIYFFGGEKVRWIEKEGEILLLEFMYPYNKNDMDQSSIHFSWQMKKSKEELEERINRFYPVGKLKDLVPQKWGESNRVIKLLISGTESQVLVKGFTIRRVLGLRDTLFIIDKEYSENGNIKNFIFSGRGYGHGVGLCQIGAFGMARAGADYMEILKRYYQGVRIDKIY